MKRIVFSSGPIRSPRVPFIFSPGLLLLGLGLLTLIAPKFVAFILASVLLAFGLIASFLAWKFMQLKRKLGEVLQQGSAAFDSRSDLRREFLETDYETGSAEELADAIDITVEGIKESDENGFDAEGPDERAGKSRRIVVH